MIYFIRHFPTEWNEKGILQGTEDIPLSNNGRKLLDNQLDLYKEYNFKTIYTSNLRRANETGKIIANHLGVNCISSNSFNELDHGHWQGKSFKELLKLKEYKKWRKDPINNFSLELSEKLKVHLESFEKQIKSIQEKSCKNCLIVTHKHIYSIFTKNKEPILRNPNDVGRLSYIPLELQI